MAEQNTIKLKIPDERAEVALAGAIEEFATWREKNMPCARDKSYVAENDLPDIMVRTQLVADAVMKVLTFSDSQGANKFLSIWEDYASA
ncbi:MAG: hypothetical protein AAF583_05130 [Pseudomonadota bacterium]